MDIEAFISWALDETRTVEERYTVEILVETGVQYWKAKRKIHEPYSLDAFIARQRERKLNPAYQPHYTQESLRKAVEFLAVQQAWSPYSDRPIRSLAPLRFMTELQEVTIHAFQGADISPLASLPALRKLVLGPTGYLHTNHECRDYTSLARCAALRELAISFGAVWPDFTGIGELTQLGTLALTGNLLTMPRGLSFPHVRTATLHCTPLPSRDVAGLPQLPACEFLTLSGAERLDGIREMPALRNLTLTGPFHSFAPLDALPALTCLTVTPESHLDPPKMPRDVSPLIRLPKLRFLKIGHAHIPDLPRDYSPLTEAPALRELIVQQCPPVEMEVAAIQAGLPPCDDLYLADEPAPLPPLRMILAPHDKCPRRHDPQFSPGESGLPDTGLRDCEGRWVGPWVQDLISRRIGHRDWGAVTANGTFRALDLQVHSFESVRKLPLILDTARRAMARLRHDYRHCNFMIVLRVPPPEDTPAQKELLEKFKEEQDRWDFEQREREEAEYLDRLHRMELKAQDGESIQPAEFSPADRDLPPEPAWEKETDDEDDEDSDDGGTATKEKPAPPASWLDDGHPLQEQYRCAGVITFGEVWFYSHFRDIAVYLMGREPDEEIPKEPAPADQ